MFKVVDAPQVKSGYERTRDYKKTEKGKRALKKYRSAKSDRDYLSKPFVAWDGEGVTRTEGTKQDYVLFANSNGDELTAGRSKYLSTNRIFEFALTRNTPGTINVIYGAGYDWNMWMRDIPRDALETLYEKGQVSWGEYWIKWRPGKSFQLGRRHTKESVLFYDVVSFFQSRFTDACLSYLGENYPHRAMIEKNKMLRGAFTDADLEEIARYCRAELENLVQLMVELRERLFKVDIRIPRWDGPGAIAVALYQMHGVKEHLRRTEHHESEAVRMAYFGGRFEVCKTGYTNSTVYEYDVNSAYPWALQDVPSMAGGRWVERTGYVHPGTDFALYYVTFRGLVSNSRMPFPLPHRLPNGNVAYPSQTTGWYWGPEIAVALEYVEKYGGELEVHKTRVFHAATDVKPFAFIGALYKKRQALKAAGDGAQVGIKLGLNSMYGKLAQQVGWSETVDGLRLPPYHQLEWAGYITSRCRAAVYGGVLEDLSCVIAFETDAMFTTHRLNVKHGFGLGEWEYTEFRDMAYLQSGTYFAHKSNGNPVDKTRGVIRGSLTFEDAYSALRDGEPTVTARSRMFIGLGLALAQKFTKWLVWYENDKVLSIFPGQKRTHQYEICIECGAEGDAVRSMIDGFHGTWPIGVRGGQVSTPCKLEWEMDGATGGDDFAGERRDNIERMSWYD